MPQLSRFFGIIIMMYFSDINKHYKPHFHVEYNEFSCSMSLPDLEVLKGVLPKTAMFLVRKWAKLYMAELLENWELATHGKPLKPIKPLV